MNKVAIVYWSGTGNTEKMARYVEEGVKSENAEVVIYTSDTFKDDFVVSYDAIAFGCPSMGDEVLEETEFQPMWDNIEKSLKGKKIALFGSYDWGDGDWMRAWENRCREVGIELVWESVICNLEPDAKAESSLKNLGRALAK